MLYKVNFINSGEIFEVYVRKIYQSDMFGFITLEEFDFDHEKKVVVDPSEEKLKSEFANITRCYIPLHNIIRIDEVEKIGTPRITEMSDKVTKFPKPIYSKNS